jgi:hypothetical protein
MTTDWAATTCTTRKRRLGAWRLVKAKLFTVNLHGILVGDYASHSIAYTA